MSIANLLVISALHVSLFSRNIFIKRCTGYDSATAPESTTFKTQLFPLHPPDVISTINESPDIEAFLIDQLSGATLENAV